GPARFPLRRGPRRRHGDRHDDRLRRLGPPRPGPRRRRRADLRAAAADRPRGARPRRRAEGDRAARVGGDDHPRAVGPHPVGVRARRGRHVVRHLRGVPQPQELRALRQRPALGQRAGLPRPLAVAGQRPGRGPAPVAGHLVDGGAPLPRLRRLDRAGAHHPGRGPGVDPAPRGRVVVRHCRGRRLGAGRGDVLRDALARPGLLGAAGVHRHRSHHGDLAAGVDDGRPGGGARRPVRDRRRADHRGVRLAARRDHGDDGADRPTRPAPAVDPGVEPRVPGADGDLDGLPGLALLRRCDRRGRARCGGRVDRGPGHRERRGRATAPAPGGAAAPSEDGPHLLGI
ncbi:MAG: hypothetical protein AVDCRST_MAG06-2027, partial [uncultured Nocardioides sp.]